MKYGFGVDLGGTTVKIAYFDETGKMLSKWEIPTRRENSGEKIIPDIRKALGQENVDIVMYDKLGHGFGLGIDTAADGWLRDAVAFWEEHRKC